MKCFNHPTVDAVASCKSCCRGLCPDCIAEVGLSCSCRNRCETDVAILNELAERGRTAYQKSSANYFRSGWFTLLLGVSFLILGAIGISGDASREAVYFCLVMGVLFVGWGVSHFVSAKGIGRK